MDPEDSIDTELVPIPRPLMVERSALEIVAKFITVIENHVQLMGNGRSGNDGNDVQRHAMVENRDVIELAPIPTRPMVVKIALVKNLKRGSVIQSHV